MTKLPGISKWRKYAGGTSVPDRYYSYQYDTPVGTYSIDPIGNDYGRMKGYRILKQWSENDQDQRILGMVNSPQKGIKVAQEDLNIRIGNKRFKV